MNIWMIVLYLVIALVVGIITLYTMGFRNWLILAVTDAEQALGSGTGKLKLRYCYDLAISKFPLIAKIIPFTLFSKMVDTALVKMKEMITSNEKIAQIVNGVDVIAQGNKKEVE